MRKLLTSAITLCVIFISAHALAETVQFQDLFVDAPEGWTVHQNANSQGTLILGFANGANYITFYAKPGMTYDTKSVFTSTAQVLREEDESHGPLQWHVIETFRRADSRAHVNAMNVAAFSTRHRNYTYYGYSHSTDRTTALRNITEFLDRTMTFLAGRSPSRSLTGHDFTGHKYYLGWGTLSGGGGSASMGNEVKYDVAHTHDIFTAKIGGDYEGKKLLNSEASPSTVKSEWTKLKSKMTAEDMYIQYSSGHGSQSGLGMGISYKEIRDAVLALPGKELIVFTMACYSGNLVGAFDQQKSKWQDFQAQGRTLFVMSSSTSSETSSTGPGTDPDEAGGPSGSAGSAFGHALWKALIGYADGQADGVTDGFLSLEEIRDFSVEKTKEFGHTPVFTGAYNGNLIMNQVPTEAQLARLTGGSTEGLSNDQIQRLIQELDREMRVR